MDKQGQISVELVLVVSFIMVVVLGITPFLSEDVELNQAMAAARSGAIEGANVNSFAIYPPDKFHEYTIENPRLLNPSNVKIVRIEHTYMGFNKRWQRHWYRLRIYASSPTLRPGDRDELGGRINFYVRKRITESFGTACPSRPFYNPAFSNRYMFTTLGVRWI
ncbi:MAG: hypothetical protein PQ964_07930 [Methanobacteriaceae archaeon]